MSFFVKNNFVSFPKKVNNNQKEKYRALNILPMLSKIFEKNLNRQLSSYFKNIFAKFQCHFRKEFRAQACLLLLTGKQKDAVRNTLDCHSYDLLIAKLNSYGISLTSLKLLIDYLINRKPNSLIVLERPLNRLPPRVYFRSTFVQ